MHGKTGVRFHQVVIFSLSHAKLSYQTFMWVQATVAARLGNMRVAQHSSVARLIHPTGGAPRVTAVMAICKDKEKHEFSEAVGLAL